ncbi:hypothetical protein [Ruminococcus sp.]|uniref:hypothetical protein n=1 Tax=Ruminococcus sp. TaxID=41978 RepID=UPI0025E447FF|nr:hypothetical protein [Ruminococcus sp.]MBQ8966060.1 hypothetical protein [Ruminococcus sp.]
MKQMGFLDNVTTPQRWKQDALERAESLENKPRLKRWQSIGVVAATAAVMVSVGIMPAVFGKKASVGDNAPAVSAAYDENNAVRRIAPAADKDTVAARLEEMKAQYDYVETVTVIDSSEIFHDGRKITQLVAARQIYKMGNRLFCINIPEDSTDHTEGGQKQMHFGDKIALGFMYTAPENIRSADVTMNINGREYTANEAIDNTEAKGYALLGGTDDDYFLDVLRSAEAVTGLAEGEYNDECQYITASNYICKMAISPDLSCMTLGDDGRFKTEALLNLFDDRLTGIDISQYIVIKLTDTKEDAIPVGKNWYISDTGEVHLGEMTGSLLVESDRPVEILGQKLVPSAEDKNTAYLVINMTDAENTGSLRGKLNITINMDGGEKARNDAAYIGIAADKAGQSVKNTVRGSNFVVKPHSVVRTIQRADGIWLAGYDLELITDIAVKGTPVAELDRKTNRLTVSGLGKDIYITTGKDPELFLPERPEDSIVKTKDGAVLSVYVQYDEKPDLTDLVGGFIFSEKGSAESNGKVLFCPPDRAEELFAPKIPDKFDYTALPEKIVSHRQNQTNNSEKTWVVYRVNFSRSNGEVINKVKAIPDSTPPNNEIAVALGEEELPMYIQAAASRDFDRFDCCGIYMTSEGFSLDLEIEYDGKCDGTEITAMFLFSYDNNNYSDDASAVFLPVQQ